MIPFDREIPNVSRIFSHIYAMFGGPSHLRKLPLQLCAQLAKLLIDSTD